ncbi:MAG: hypothetical protein ACP5TO_03755 [Thermoplasmata archaeon]
MNILGVQFKISNKDFSIDYFMKHVEKFYKKTEPGDLIIFPEDVGLAVAFNGITGSNITEAMQNVYLKNETGVMEIKKIFPDASFIKLLFLSMTDTFVKDFYNFYSELSKSYNIYTITCNNMANFKKSEKKYFPVEDKVYNSCFLFDGKGNLMYKQDKVNLTQMEKDLNLDPNLKNKIKYFKINDKKFGIAISLDAFCIDYLNNLYNADIIIQPDANPVKWNSFIENGRWQPEEWMDSAYYIAQRLPNVKFVLNPMMVGNIFDLNFEGQSSITKKAEKSDEKMAYIGNIPTTGFHSLLGIKNFQPYYYNDRNSVEKLTLDYEEGVIEVEI